MNSILAMIWKLIKIYGGHLLSLAYRLVKATIRAWLWKWSIVGVMLAVTLTLAYLVLR